MLNKLSFFLANKIKKRSKECLYDIDIYIYGIEIIFSTVGTFLSILLTSILFSEVKSAFVFVCVFVPLRLFAGGYHADTYSKCFIISNLSWIVVLKIKNIIWRQIPIYLLLLAIIVIVYYIWKNAPVQNENQPLNEKKKKWCRKAVNCILMIDMFWVLILALNNIELMCMAVLSCGLVTLYMRMADKKVKRKERREKLCV